MGGLFLFVKEYYAGILCIEIDNILLLTARSIGGVFLPVKGYFSSKNRG
jgi:hypothetical protein